MNKIKPKVAFFDLTGCNGCLLSMINDSEFLKVIDSFNISSFRLVKGENIHGPYDLSFVEGYAGSEEEISHLKEIREQSKILVAIGACACTGNIQGIRNFLNQEEVKNYVYHNGSRINVAEAKSIDAYVKTDLYILGCPPNGKEIVETLKSFLIGKTPELITHAVCVECKMRETECILVRGTPCLGPISRGGCGAPCPAVGYICDGCRGPSPDPNIPSEVNILKKLLGEDDITLLFRRYAALQDGFKKIAEGKLDG